MAIKQRLMGSGLAAQAATNIVGDGATGLTATGTTQGTAYVLTAANSQFSTTAASTGALLFDVDQFDMVFVDNDGANALLVYPPSGHNINALAANAGYSIAAGKGALFIKCSTTAWISFLSA